ncbi:putative non-specific serine/threonine protein kinase [Helianthus anomalus]
MVNGTVRDHLSTKSETPLLWNMRLKVAQDVARGLTYLHEEMDFQLLDFGVAWLGPQEGFTHISTKRNVIQVNVSTPFFGICPHRWKKMMNQWLFQDEQQ